MKIKNLTISKRWIFVITAIVLLSIGYFVVTETQIMAQGDDRNRSTTTTQNGAEVTTIPIQPASSVVGAVSAAGHIELVSQQQVALEVAGEVVEIAVNVGDEVQVGDPLLSLNSAELERAVARAALTVETQQNAITQLTAAADAADIAVAQANLTEAQENLADVLAGPSDEAIAAARSSLSSAWSKYNEWQAGPSDAELTQLSADLKTKEIALAEARRAYEQIAWRNDVGMTPEAAALQQATIDYESAQAAYEESIAPANASDVQSALSAAQNAQASLDDLLNSPTPAEIASAEANVASVQATLDDLLAGIDTLELRDAEIALEQALIDLQEAHVSMAAAQIVAPIDGIVLAINADVGERVSQGATIATLADETQLALTIDVAEVDIVQVAVGQATAVEIDALPGEILAGTVEYIAPASDTTAGVVSYPVTIRLTDDALDRVLPGMTSVATIAETEAAASNGWLVPTSAIQQENDAAIVMVAHEEGNSPVAVVPGNVQGEWTIVQSAELQAGDQVVGSVTSQINEDSGFGGPGGGGREGGGGGGPFGRG